MAEQFVAPTPWRAARPEALVVCCSDGRWHEQVEEFIRQQVSERADVYAVPGGPAIFYWWTSSFDENRVAEKHFRFIAEHHELRSVWLIAHEECAYYKEQCPGVGPVQIRERQEEDLERARQTIVQWYPHLSVTKIYATRSQDRVVFTVINGN